MRLVVRWQRQDGSYGCVIVRGCDGPAHAIASARLRHIQPADSRLKVEQAPGREGEVLVGAEEIAAIQMAKGAA